MYATQESTDDLLLPVLQEYEKRQSQLRLDAFYTMTHRFAKIKSKRLQAAVSTAMGRALPDEMVISEPVASAAPGHAASEDQREQPAASKTDRNVPGSGGKNQNKRTRVSNDSEDGMGGSDRDVDSPDSYGVWDPNANGFFY